MQVILHCGLPKTGSSSLQSSLSRAFDVLKNEGVHYIRSCTDQEGAHTVITAFFIAQYIDKYGMWGADGLLLTNNIPETSLQFRDLSIFDILDKKLSKDVFYANDGIFATLNNYMIQFESEVKGLSASDKSVVISSEHLGALVSDKRLVDIIYSYFSRFFKRIKVVIYLRDPLRTAISSYGQTIRLGYSREFYSPNEDSLLFLDYPNLEKLWSNFEFNVDLIFKHYKENKTNEPKSSSFNITQDFCSHFHITPPPDSSIRTNQSLNVMQLTILKKLNKLIYGESNELVDRNRKGDDDFYNYVASVGKGYGPFFPGFLISKNFINAYEHSYRFMEDKLNIKITREEILQPSETAGETDLLIKNASDIADIALQIAASIYINKTRYIRSLN